MFSTPGRQHSNSCSWRRESETPYSKQYPWNCAWLTSSVICTKADQELIFSTCNGVNGRGNSLSKDEFLVQKSGQEFVIGRLLHDKLCTVIATEYAQVSTVNCAPSLAVWHRWLGHLNYTYMKQLVKKEMIDGMNYDADNQP